MTTLIRHSLLVDAPIAVVWDSLVDPVRMAAWMGEPDMQLRIDVDWRAGGRISVHGRHHVRFENRGVVLGFAPYARLRYTQLSSLSRLPDAPCNYTTLDFHLVPSGAATQLTLALSGFPTDSIYRHMDFYWAGTLEALRQHVQGRAQASLP